MNLINYYKILQVEINSIDEEIKNAYKLKISQFYGLPFLTDKMKVEIKDLKIAVYILMNANRKYLYDKKFNFGKDDEIKNTQICDRLFSLPKLKI